MIPTQVRYHMICNRCGFDKDISDFYPKRTSYCKQCENEKHMEWHFANKEKVQSYQQNNRRKYKLMVVNHYSNGTKSCACCGEREMQFLTLDHIDGGGTKEQKVLQKDGYHFYKWLIDHLYPTGYQVLCWNCNCGRNQTKDKICPHKKQIKLYQDGITAGLI